MEAAHSRLLSVESEKPLPFMTGPSSAVRTALLALVVFVVSYLIDMLADTTIIFTSHGMWLIGPTNGLLVAVSYLSANTCAVARSGEVHVNYVRIFQPSVRVVVFSFCLSGHGAASNFPVTGGEPARPDPTGWYTAAQATSGAHSYQKICASCHGAKLQGGMAPALVGKQFWTAYGGKKLSTLWSTVHTEMPMTSPGSVSPKDSIIDLCINNAIDGE